MILTVLSRKGGVGKTTTAVNLAAELAAEGPTLIIDLDSQGNVGLSLGIELADLSPSIMDAMLDGEPMDDVLRSTAVPNLSLITCEPGFRDASNRISRLVAGERPVVLQAALEEVSDRFDHIVMDTGELDLVTANALLVSDAYIMTVQPEKLAMDGLRFARGEIDKLGAAYGFETPLLGVLFTMVMSRILSQQDVVTEIRKALQDAVFVTEIPRNTRVSEAPWSGLPVTMAYPASTGAAAYSAFVLEVLQRAKRMVAHA